MHVEEILLIKEIYGALSLFKEFLASIHLLRYLCIVSVLTSTVVVCIFKTFLVQVCIGPSCDLQQKFLEPSRRLTLLTEKKHSHACTYFLAGSSQMDTITLDHR